MPDTKTFGTIAADIKAAAPTEEDPNGTFEAILSAPTVDRDGEVIDGKAFEPLPDHLTIDVDHGMSTDTTVGSGTPFYDGDVLKFKGSFSSLPRAQEVRTLITEGHIRKMSVAFMNANRYDNEDDGRVHIGKAELLNAAIVPIPSNREASILAAKAAKAHAEELLDEPVATAEDEKAAPVTGPAPSVLLALAKAKAQIAEAAVLLT
jgi:hypothetical protein